MTPQTLLAHIDNGQLWEAALPTTVTVEAAYQTALQVRALRLARGEQARGFKIGFTNRKIWPRYNVFAPIWGTVWDSTLVEVPPSGCAEAQVSLTPSCQPRIEPEAVFGLRATPAPNATLDQLFDAVEWMAPGFEVVQSHLPDWKFTAAASVADSGLHARLLVGRQVLVRDLVSDAAQLDTLLGQAQVSLLKHGTVVEHGRGANVLDSPLRAFHHFLTELRQCPGAPDLQAGDVVTTGTWTDAWPVQAGERWTAQFSEPLSDLSVNFV